MSEPGFVTNFTAGFCSSRCFFLPPHRLQDAYNIENIGLFHIYVIVRAPRIRMVPDSFSNFFEKPKITVKIGHEFSKMFREVYFPSSWGVNDVKVADAGGRSFRMESEAGPGGGDIPMLCMMDPSRSDVRVHDVVYVGQAYGSDGSRNVLDRLTKHETLQKIVSENSVEAPETDVFVYAFQYQENDMMFITFNGSDKNLIGDSRDTDRLNQVLDNPIDDKEMTQIVEAGLIRYFQPVYNRKFVDLFPKRSYGFLSDLHHLDYEGFSVEINTEELRTRLRSSATGDGSHHIATYQIKPGHQVKGIMSFTGLMEATGLHPSSGPIF